MIDPGDAVALMEAGGERAEAELVAAEVLAALQRRRPAEEIVVVCRSLRPLGRAVRARPCALRGAGDQRSAGLPLAHTALGRALLALVAVRAAARRAATRRGPDRLPAPPRGRSTAERGGPARGRAAQAGRRRPVRRCGSRAGAAARDGRARASCAGAAIRLAALSATHARLLAAPHAALRGPDQCRAAATRRRAAAVSRGARASSSSSSRRAPRLPPS